MTRKPGLLTLLILSLVALGVTSCRAAGSEPESAPEVVVSARDTAVDHVRSRFLTGPDPTLQWEEFEVSAAGAIGWVEFEYRAGSWIVTVAGPSRDRYQVVIANPAESFQWTGGVDAAGRVVEGPMKVVAACEEAASFIDANLAGLHLAGLEWEGVRVTPEGHTGDDTYRLSAGDWIATVSFPIIGPGDIGCHVALENPKSGFVWEGDVDDAGEATETAAYSRAPWITGGGESDG
jgi:hypothetical protein